MVRLSDFSTLCFEVWSLQDLWGIQVVYNDLLIFNRWFGNARQKKCNPSPPSGGRYRAFLEKWVLWFGFFFFFFFFIPKYNYAINISFMSMLKSLHFIKVCSESLKEPQKFSCGPLLLLCFHLVVYICKCSWLLERPPAFPVTLATETLWRHWLSWTSVTEGPAFLYHKETDLRSDKRK